MLTVNQFEKVVLYCLDKYTDRDRSFLHHFTGVIRHPLNTSLIVANFLKKIGANLNHFGYAFPGTIYPYNALNLDEIDKIRDVSQSITANFPDDKKYCLSPNMETICYNPNIPIKTLLLALRSGKIQKKTTYYRALTYNPTCRLNDLIEIEKLARYEDVDSAFHISKHGIVPYVPLFHIVDMHLDNVRPVPKFHVCDFLAGKGRISEVLYREEKLTFGHFEKTRKKVDWQKLVRYNNNLTIDWIKKLVESGKIIIDYDNMCYIIGKAFNIDPKVRFENEGFLRLLTHFVSNQPNLRDHKLFHREYYTKTVMKYLV